MTNYAGKHRAFKSMLAGVAVFLLFPAAGSCGESAPVSSEEYDVYSVVLESHKQEFPGASKMVILENTVTNWTLNDDSARYIEEELARAPGGEAHELDRALISDFNNKNQASSVLEEKFTILQYILLLKDNIYDEIFSEYNDEDGWDQFYKIFPGSTGVIEFSRVGFNADHTEALLYMGNQRHWLAGVGYYFVLKKDAPGGKWRISGQAMAYVS